MSEGCGRVDVRVVLWCSNGRRVVCGRAWPPPEQHGPHPTHHPLSFPSPVDARTRGNGGGHVDAQGQSQAPQEGAGKEIHRRVDEDGIGRETQAEKHEQEGARGFRKATSQHLVLPVLLREDSEQVLEMASHCHDLE